MATVALNKASLHREWGALARYRRFLPSLDLKRRQLTADLAAARADLAAREAEAAALTAEVGERLPMLANEAIEVGGLVRVERVELGEENRLGVRLPVLQRVAFGERAYGLLAKPHWVDALVAELRRAAELRLRLAVGRERVRRLEQAVRRTTQRVNLFDRVLIPTATANIRRIEVALADADRAAVVRSKIAKAKHARSRGERLRAEEGAAP